ncbi:MAG: heparinase II/III family protein, partial [Candidatus Krumholzibacteriota bacterium]|nr:heparinase II/III family protein [Candidatus Krumholzibacteriota bacterium]
MRGSWRLRRALRRLEGRIQRPAPPSPPAALLAASLAPAQLRGGRPDAARLREAFRPIHGPAALDGLAALPGADDGLLAMARGVARGELPWFDRTLPAALPADWLRVPGAARWPLLPETAYRSEDFVRYGDIALLWELGRLQILPALAAAARVSGDREPARQGLDLLADFRRANPVGWGPHWLSGLEAALRIHSLLWAWMLLRDPGDADTLLLAASLVENARFVETHLSLKAVANNHLLGEASGLYCLGCALPCLTGATRWRERGRELLDRELPAQVLADGVTGEQAVAYHRFVLELALHALLWGRAVGDDPAPAWGQRLADMLPPLAALTGPDGRLVALGDDSGARVLRLDRTPLADARGLVDAAARLLGAAVPGPPAGPPRGTCLWILGPEPPERPPAVEAPATASFPAAGWYTARFGAPGRGGLPGGHLVFRAGPMGRGGAGHSHLDLLALTLSLGGEPVLVDPGTYLYNAPLSWRDRFRGAGGHSLLRAGGRDPARPEPAPDRFGWVTRARAVLEDAAAQAPPWLWQGLREGDRDPDGRPLTVARALALLPPGWLVVIDEVAASGAGSGPVPLELLWQCAAGLEARWDAGGGPRCEAQDAACRTLRLARGGRPVLEAVIFAPA